MSIKDRLNRLERTAGKNYFCEGSRIIVVQSADDVKMREENKGYRRFMALGEAERSQIFERLCKNDGGLSILIVKEDGLLMGGKLIAWHEIEPLYSLPEERDTTKEGTI